VAEQPKDTGSIATYTTSLRVIRKIAEGGMGTVFLAEQLGVEGFAKTVAIKVIRKEMLNDIETVTLFLDEARLVADLVHPHIVQVYNLAEYKGRYFVIMEYVHGVTARDFLLKHLDQGRTVPTDLAAFIVSRVCRGLYYAHRKQDRKGRHLGIVHRDVTPTNILCDFRGNVKLSDFGIAKALTMNVPDETKVIMGKLPYMSPEQAQGQETDARSDIYSLGLCLHELLTGSPVFMPSSREELIRLQQRGVPPVDQQRKSVPPQLARIVAKAVEYDVGARYQDANEFGTALETYMYSDRYGPTLEKLAEYMRQIFPDIPWDRVE
jgi:serine/threonine protein kinase